MKREIKFRGKRVSLNDWLYGYLREVYGWDKRAFVISPSERFDTGGCTDLDEDSVQADTICQFTGMYDKNGNEIYEGDIVLQQGYNGRKTIMAVRFEHGAFIVGYHNGSSTQKRPMLLSDKCEVIGNIYDNKELLEQVNNS